MTNIKTPVEIQIMTEGGKKLHHIREQLLGRVVADVTPLEIDNLAKMLIKKAGGSPSFISVGDYKWATCISVNDGVVHGIPTDKPFKDGDIVGLDVGLLYQEYHTDTSWTKIVQSSTYKIQSKIENFIQVGEIALNKAIAQARVGNRIGHISQAIQNTVEDAGFSVVRSLVGHGLGKKLHEPPQIPGILTKPVEKTPQLVSRMVLAIEVIYNQARSDIVYKNDDHWSLVSQDGSLSGLFEQTVVVSEKGPIILT